MSTRVTLVPVRLATLASEVLTAGTVVTRWIEVTLTSGWRFRPWIQLLHHRLDLRNSTLAWVSALHTLVSVGAGALAPSTVAASTIEARAVEVTLAPGCSLRPSIFREYLNVGWISAISEAEEFNSHSDAAIVGQRDKPDESGLRRCAVVAMETVLPPCVLVVVSEEGPGCIVESRAGVGERCEVDSILADEYVVGCHPARFCVMSESGYSMHVHRLTKIDLNMRCRIGWIWFPSSAAVGASHRGSVLVLAC
jgi:hypothetical protein